MIKEGDRIPSLKLMTVTSDGTKEADTAELFGHGKVVMFAVPGAFTPTCSAKHLPGFVEYASAFKAKGVERVICLAVNDSYVLTAWAKEQKAGDVVMLADGSGAFTKALGLELDLSARGLGLRSQRFALIAKDGVVTHLAVEEAGGFEVSRAEEVLAKL